MARKCKCAICKKEMSTDEAYKVEENGKRKYYCSEVEYQGWKAIKDKAATILKEFNDLVTRIFGYKMTNTMFYKEKSQWLEVFSEEIIVQYLKENEAYLTDVIGKLSGNELGRIRYLSAIIKNSMRDFKPKPKAVEEVKPRVVESNFELFEPTVKQDNYKETILDDVEDDLI